MRRYAHIAQSAGLLMHQVVHNPGRNAIYRCFLGNTVLSQFIERSNSKTQLAEINCSIGFIFRRKQIIAAICVLHAKAELASMEWTSIDFHGTHNWHRFHTMLRLHWQQKHFRYPQMQSFR